MIFDQHRRPWGEGRLLLLLLCANPERLRQISDAISTTNVVLVPAQSSEQAWAIACQCDISAVLVDQDFASDAS